MPEIDLTVYFCHRQGVEHYMDEGFQTLVKWDIPLLEGYHFEFLPNWRNVDQVGGFFSLMNGALVNALRRDRPDALWVNGHLYFSYVLGILAANLLNIPLFMRCETHLLIASSGLKRVLRRPVMWFLYNKLCERCLTIGSRNRMFYMAHGVPESHMFLVPYAVDNAYFMERVGQERSAISKVRSDFDLPGDRPLILYLSKLAGIKRPMDLVVAYHRLLAKGIDCALAIVGSGGLELELKAYVAEHQLSNVYFFGFRNQSELPQFYAAADVFVFPSERETWGLVLNEAMCAGLPVIASVEIGATADLIREGENGFTYPAGDIDQLTHHLTVLLTDAPRRQAMGQRSREIIANWDFEKCAQGVLAALQSLKSE